VTILTETARPDNVPSLLGSLLTEMASSPVEYPAELLSEAVGAAALFVAEGNPLEEAADMAEMILDEGMVERLYFMSQRAKEMADNMKERGGEIYRKAKERARAAADAAADAAAKAGKKVSNVAARTGKSASEMRARVGAARAAWKAKKPKTYDGPAQSELNARQPGRA
jgi:hypothetical protein